MTLCWMKTSGLEERMRQRDNTKEAPLFKILIPIGPFRYGEISHALSDGLYPPEDWPGTRKRMPLLPR